MKKLIVALGFALLAAPAMAATTSAPDHVATVQNKGVWKKVGTQTVSYIPEKDVFKVRGNESWDQMRIKIVGATLNMYNMKVIYEDGTTQQVPMKMRYKDGEQSRAFFLKKGKQVKEVRFLYETKGKGDGRAKIELWAIDRILR